MLRGDIFGKNDRYPANQRGEMSRKAFKTTKMFCFLPYTEPTEMLWDDFFGKKRHVPRKPTWEDGKKSVQNKKSGQFSALHRVYRNVERWFFFGKSDRYPTNQREEMSRKAFKATKMLCFLPYTEYTEMLWDDFFFFGKKRQVPSKPTWGNE